MRLCFGLALAILFTGSVHGTLEDAIANDESELSSQHDVESYISEEETLKTTRLNIIAHVVRPQNIIDLSLSREDFEEDCYVTPPGGQLTKASLLSMDGVKVQDKSNFVSCRITIGPMNQNLIGSWELCGTSTSLGETRCQPITITFDTGIGYAPINQARYTHPVHFGGAVNTGIVGSGNVITCHVITPAGEDLVITPDVSYPHIERSTAANAALCSVLFKDITIEMLGDWVLYGRFMHMFGENEVRFPLTFELYNEDNPYEQAYNVTILNNQEHTVKLGGDLSVEVTQTAGTVENCIYISPSGQTFEINDLSDAPTGVEFKSADTRAVCKITFDPITLDVVGRWQIIGKFRNGVLFNERRLTFRVVREGSDEGIKLLSVINHFTRQNAIIEISLNKESFEEECFVQPPYEDLIKASLVTIPGVKVQKSSDFVSCRVTLGPLTQDLLGVWRLCGQSIVNGEIRCRPANITWNSAGGSGDWHITDRPMFAHPVHRGGSVNTGVSSTGTLETCHVVTPAGEDLVITTDMNYPHIERSTLSNVYLCSVVIKDITQSMLGDWKIYGRFRSIFGQTEVRLPLIFNLYDENNPYDQAYNITLLENQSRLVHVGTNLDFEIRQRTGVREDCIYTAPSGNKFSINTYSSGVPTGVSFTSSDTEAVCQIVFNPITEGAVGTWQIAAKFRNGVLFDDRRQSFTIIVEDPDNPLEDHVERDIQYLPEQKIITDMNTHHRITISRTSLIENESCHLLTPDGRQYAFIDGFNVPNVEIIRESEVECGVIVHVNEESMIGNWTIFGRAARFSVLIERRQSVTIRVEENFVLQNDIQIREGADLYLHLNDAISIPETCMLLGPDGEQYTKAAADSMHISTCGYIVRNVDHTHKGRWIIEYGRKIKKRGSVNVLILGSEEVELENLQWNIGDSINIAVGPKNAVYCVIHDPVGYKLFDNFGQCKIVIERVLVNHRGVWTMQIGKPGTVLLQSYDFYVDIHSVDNLPIVNTTVEKNLPSVLLTCSVPAAYEVHACKFRDPRGNTLVAAHGVGQDEYMFNGSLVNYESDAHSHDCTLRLINPSARDLGIWRCGLDTSTGTHYGFLTVICPHLMRDPEVAASVISEPELQSTNLTYLEDDPVTLSCFVPSAIRYCYFRARNGTIFNVFPRMSSSQNFEYVGDGLDAGDCGIRFSRFSPNESDRWSCHVGLVNTTTPELRTDVFADVTPKMTVRHFWRDHVNIATVEARVYHGLEIDYCRFVRMNGEGFNSDNVPFRYELEHTLYKGLCTLHIRDPDILDLHPWTVVAKLKSMDGEFSITTTENLLLLPVYYHRSVFANALFWIIIALICLMFITAASALLPKKNREWTYRRASRLSRSFRSSWRKSFVKKSPPRIEGA